MQVFKNYNTNQNDLARTLLIKKNKVPTQKY